MLRAGDDMALFKKRRGGAKGRLQGIRIIGTVGEHEGNDHNTARALAWQTERDTGGRGRRRRRGHQRPEIQNSMLSVRPNSRTVSLGGGEGRNAMTTAFLLGRRAC